MKVEFDNDRPIYIQLVEQLKKMIISSEYYPGSKLPSIRDISSQFKINPNTVQKALQELENDKLIYTERTNGKYVTKDTKLINKIKENIALESTKKYINDMKQIGMNKKEIITFIDREDDK